MDDGFYKKKVQKYVGDNRAKNIHLPPHYFY